MVVVLPAPFGPSRPKTSPGRTPKLTPASACTVPKLYRSRSHSTASRWSDISVRSLPQDLDQSVQCGQRAGEGGALVGAELLEGGAHDGLSTVATKRPP